MGPYIWTGLTRHGPQALPSVNLHDGETSWSVSQLAGPSGRNDGVGPKWKLNGPDTPRQPENLLFPLQRLAPPGDTHYRGWRLRTYLRTVTASVSVISNRIKLRITPVCADQNPHTGVAAQWRHTATGGDRCQPKRREKQSQRMQDECFFKAATAVGGAGAWSLGPAAAPGPGG